MCDAEIRQVTNIYRTATGCRVCFEGDEAAEAPTIDIAQPRWVGRDYWRSKPRVLLLMRNPASGDFREDTGDQRMRELLRAFRDGRLTLEAIFDQQIDDFKNWGLRTSFYDYVTRSLELSFPRISVANIALCAIEGDKPPSIMLTRCFRLHTAALLRLLAPDLILLMGGAVQKFWQANLPENFNIRTFDVLAYAHRKGRGAEHAQLLRLKTEIGTA